MQAGLEYVYFGASPSWKFVSSFYVGNMTELRFTYVCGFVCVWVCMYVRVCVYMYDCYTIM